MSRARNHTQWQHAGDAAWVCDALVGVVQIDRFRSLIESVHSRWEVCRAGLLNRNGDTNVLDDALCHAFDGDHLTRRRSV